MHFYQTSNTSVNKEKETELETPKSLCKLLRGRNALVIIKNGNVVFNDEVKKVVFL